MSKRLLDEQISGIIEKFHRDGVANVPGFLSGEECQNLRHLTDDIFDDEQKFKDSQHSNKLVISNPLLHHRVFADLFMCEPILSLVESILGPECRFCGQSVIRNPPGETISYWHIDDCNNLDFPLPDDVPRHDVRVVMPVFWLSVQIPLTDIDTLEDGPTEIVRGSHYSGRLVPTQDEPQFEGRGSEAIFCKAGAAYLFNHQIWHRGRPNQSQRTRYLLQLQYTRDGTMASRFQGSLDDPRLDAILRDADERKLRVLGRTMPTYGM
ncbi:MAG: phytanoyl-CoA dioxygenase family protein [Abditibacteriaceae bacterium]